ncbi:MAG: protein-L-isoaspartate O-methyltransferase, partial [Proteobacteria bacterium]|nr:protein-L-isoaspartate O-methyltransferase [Pseudomonadota bacterium]
MNIDPARFNMIEQQIRPWGVLNPKVIDGLRELDRQYFVPLQYKTMAYADIEIPLEQGQCMLRPKIEARLIQALLPTHHDDILEIGTGSGFMTALLAT